MLATTKLPTLPRIKRRILIAYLVVAASILVVGIAVFQTVRTLTAEKNDLVFVHSRQLVDAARLAANAERIVASARGFLVTADDRTKTRFEAARARFTRTLTVLRQKAQDDETRELLDDVADSERAYSTELELLMASASIKMAPMEAKQRLETLQPLREALDGELTALRDIQQADFDEAVRSSAVASSQSIRNLLAAAALAVCATLGLAVMLVRALREVERREKDLDRANRDLDAFAGRIAHDLKNAISPLSVAAQSMSRRSTAAGGDVGELIARRLRVFSELIDGLLAFSRAGQPDRTLRAEIKTELEEVRSENSALATELGVTIDVASDNLPVACAPGLLHMLVANLVGNALKCLRGRAERRLLLRARRVGPSCEIVVEDTGPGIPADALAHIFEPFYRVPGNVAPGSGIGLATVHRIVEAHKGSISVSSTVGVGTRFEVLLPLAEPTGNARQERANLSLN